MPRAFDTVRRRTLPLAIGLLGGVLLALALGFAGSAAAKSAQPLKWSSAKLVDHARPYGDPAEIGGVSCPTQSLCIGVGSHGTVVATRGATTKVVNSDLDSYLVLRDVSCPTNKLCVAIAGNAVLSTTNPGAAKPTWKRVALKIGVGLLQTITCPTAALCVAPASTGAVWVSTHPTGAASAWKPTTLTAPGQFIGAVGCARGATLCVAAVNGVGGSAPQLLTTTKPAAGRSSWSAAPAPGPATWISCPSTALCVAISYDDILASTDPTAGGATWSATKLLTVLGTALTAIDCGSASRCTATVSDGSVLTTTDPAGGASAWTRSPVLGPNSLGTSSQTAMACRPDGSCLIPYLGGGLATIAFGPPATVAVTGQLSGLTAIRGLACPSTTLCIGVDDAGAVLRTTKPTGAASSWKRQVQTPVTHGLNSVSCPRTGFCAAVGDDDTLGVSTKPGSPSTWSFTTLPFTFEEGSGATVVDDLGAISCASPSACVATDSVNQLLVSTRPGGGAAAWKAVTVGQFDYDSFIAVSCPLASLCAAGDVQNGQIAVSTNPTRSWKLFRIAPRVRNHAPAITAVSCTRTKFCLAGDQTGAIYSSSKPTAGAKAFKRVKLTSATIVSISCRSAKLCVAIDGSGRAWSSTNPSGSRSAWHSVTLDRRNYPTNSGIGRRLSALACAPKSVCVIGDGAGRVFSSAG
jgi:hypothetical protein